FIRGNDFLQSTKIRKIQIAFAWRGRDVSRPYHILRFDTPSTNSPPSLSENSKMRQDYSEKHQATTSRRRRRLIMVNSMQVSELRSNSRARLGDKKQQRKRASERVGYGNNKSSQNTTPAYFPFTTRYTSTH
ncbi:MAG: hypothetical protein Q4B68_02525, partial [Bacteroidales bacterium]|nr:hypothetical protein [Bacteroidales bacterium]